MNNNKQKMERKVQRQRRMDGERPLEQDKKKKQRQWRLLLIGTMDM